MIFADSCYLIAFESRNDPSHKQALAVSKFLRDSRLANGYEGLTTTDLLLIEAAEGVCRQSHGMEASKVYTKLANEIDVVKTTTETHSKGLEYLRIYGRDGEKVRRLGFTDCISVVVMRDRQIGKIISSDTGFDRVNIVNRGWSVEEIKARFLA